MYKKHNSLLTALLLVSSFDAGALGINGSQVPTATNKPVANDDHASVIIGVKTSAIGNVSSNDLYGTVATFNGSTVGKYGYLELAGSIGLYTYKLFDSTDTASLPGGAGTDSFTYTYSNDTGQADYARLIVEVSPDPAFAQTDDQPYDNVDVEFNDRSAQATSLNSGRNIKGHLYNSGDKDWYSLASAGNEIITLEVCPKGTSCYDPNQPSGKPKNGQSWVLYVFDSDLLTKEMEERTYKLKHWVKETGNTKDESGEVIIDFPIIGESNHMYLAYEKGFFNGALIGIVDPCFDDSNSVEIGVGPGSRNYLIAISSSLKGDDKSSVCGAGSTILEKASRPALGHEASTIDESGNEVAGAVKSYETIEEYLVAAPNSDDQYSIKITGTGINPLLSDAAEVNSATFSFRSGRLMIPNVLVDKQNYHATLNQQMQKTRSGDSTMKFILADINTLSVEQVVDAYRATFNLENQQVLIPRVTDTETGNAYSVILQYNAANNDGQQWFEVVSITEIQ